MGNIDAYSFGSMTVDGEIYNADLIIFPDRIKAEWWRREGHALAVEDLDEVLAYKPEILVIGRGYSSCMQIPPDTKKALQYANIQVIDKSTGEAYPIFNRKLREGKKIVGAFHLTC